MDAQLLADKLARHFEGCRLTAYQDSAGVWTIGWGHTFGVKPGDVIDQERADYMLGLDIAAALSVVPKTYPPAARAALADFAYNLGHDALRQLLAHADPQNQFDRWVHAGGQVLQGLVKRRAVEAFLFSLGDL